MAVTLKSTREVARMREAGRIVAEVHDLLRSAVRPGVTTAELNQIAHDHIVASDGTPAFLGYNGFPGSICTSVNEEIVHGIPGQRELEIGDIISIDVGVIYQGYYGDAARTLAVGDVAESARQLISATEGSFWEGLRHVRDGARMGDVAAAIQSYAESRGFHVVREYVGHGIGRDMHEAPQVPNFGQPGTGFKLRKGMTLAIEPMLNIDSPWTRQLEDGWTVVTESGGYSAHYENTVLVTDDEPEVLTCVRERVV